MVSVLFVLKRNLFFSTLHFVRLLLIGSQSRVGRDPIDDPTTNPVGVVTPAKREDGSTVPKAEWVVTPPTTRWGRDPPDVPATSGGRIDGSQGWVGRDPKTNRLGSQPTHGGHGPRKIAENEVVSERERERERERPVLRSLTVRAV